MSKRVKVQCYRHQCEFNDDETCVNDELSIGSSGLCLCVEGREDEEAGLSEEDTEA